jgi:hypothetical protein
VSSFAFGLSMVPGGGVEPPRPDKGRRILSPLRLPVPPSRQVNGINRLAQVHTEPKFAGAQIVPTI